MKRFIAAMVVVAVLITGCGLLHKNPGTYGPASTQEDKQKDKIGQIDNSLNKNSNQKLNTIGEFSWGTDYALSKDTNPAPSSAVAKDLNARIISLANQPNIDQVKEMKSLVDMLLTNNAKAIKLLKEKDEDIMSLQNEQRILLSEKDKEIKKYIDLANATAAKADQYKATISEMDGFMGFGAIWYGIKKFVTSSMWILGIGSIIFLILRLAAGTNPIAASIFGIFEHMVSWVINTLRILAPKALSIAGNVSKDVFEKSHTLLKKIVDNIQSIKLLEEKTGKDITLKEVLVELDKSLNDDEKDIVKQIKKEMGYR